MTRCQRCGYNFEPGTVPAPCYVCEAMARRTFGDFVACFALALLGGFDPPPGLRPEPAEKLRWWRR